MPSPGMEASQTPAPGPRMCPHAARAQEEIDELTNAAAKLILRWVSAWRPFGRSMETNRSAEYGLDALVEAAPSS